MKLVLHIGTEKTGTTLLQDWLYRNQENLSRSGFYLSNILERNNNRKLVSYFQNGLDDWAATKGITSLDEKNAYFEGFEEEFRRDVDLSSAHHHTMIITSEHFHSRLQGRIPVSALAGFLNGIFSSVKIVGYFREQSQMATSLYSTAMRVSSKSTLREFLENVTPQNYYYNFFQIGQNWASAFGKENCDFRIYRRADFLNGDLRQDFASAIGSPLDPETLSYDVTSSNESLSALEASLYRIVNEEIPYWKKDGSGVNIQNPKLKNAISSIKAVKQGEIDHDGAEEIFDRFREDNRRFFEEFLPETVAFSKPNTRDTAEQARASITQSELEVLLAKIIRSMA